MNILITGCNGQLGTWMRRLSALHTSHHFVFTDIVAMDAETQVLDITDAAAVQSFIQEQAIELIVNCAAYTNVDKAEEDEPTARCINAQAVEVLGSAISPVTQMPCRVIHISTDYVFAGDEHLPCREQDAVAPRTAYGRTKLEGEQRLIQVNPQAIIFRTAWLYSEFGNNFVKTMLRLSSEHELLRVVYDQIGTPTYARDLAELIYTAIESAQWHAGIYHFTDEGVCSWYDFTVEILRQTGSSCHVEPILSSEYRYRTPRPHYSVLDKAKVKAIFGITIPYWSDSLRVCLAGLK